MKSNIQNKTNLYQITVIFSVLFALVGFSYNVWRMEASEENSNIRTACFEMLLELSSLEQLIYAAHYDHDTKEGNPRIGWIKVGLIADLSVLSNDAVEEKTTVLKNSWGMHWENMTNDRKSVNKIVNSIEDVRSEIKRLLVSLE